MSVDRIQALESMVAEDPGDLMARLLLGNEYLSAGRATDALPHLTAYCAESSGDKGAACLSLARALAACGDAPGARAAIEHGIDSAKAYRHRALLETLESERERLMHAGGTGEGA